MRYGAKPKGPSKAGTLCVKLAREAVFGLEVLLHYQTIVIISNVTVL